MKKLVVILSLVLVSVCSFGQSADLKGRNVLSLPVPDYNAKESGTIVVDIWVDNYGNVTKAESGAEGTTLTNKSLLLAARNAAMKAHFSQKADAPALQKGTITYIYTLNGRNGDGYVQRKAELFDTPSLEKEINEGSLKFLGIPIDGTESQFVSQLKSKGFTYNSISESYKGQFNGDNVDVFIHTNHNQVDRVYVAFPYKTEEGIRVEYNRLLRQFKDNEKYLDLVMNEEIPVDDDISYEMSVNNKRYQASFSYFDFSRDPIEFLDAMLSKVSDFFTPEQISVLREYATKAMDSSADEREFLQTEMMAEMQRMGLSQDGDSEPDPMQAMLFFATFLDGMRSLADGDVWFMIHERYGRYNIGLYYDNLHNQAHGEDL